MVDMLMRRGAFRALAELRKMDPEPMTAGQLQRAIGLSIDTCARLRKDLEEAGLLLVDEGVNNKVPFVVMRLTPEGRVVATHALRAEADLQKALESKRKRKSDTQ